MRAQLEFYIKFKYSSDRNINIDKFFQLALLTGVAALLRFPMPELEDMVVDSDSDSDG